MVFNCKHLLIANCKCMVPVFAINRFANINVHVYYNTVWGRPSQLLDSQFGLDLPRMQSLNYTIKNLPTVLCNYSVDVEQLDMVIKTLNFCQCQCQLIVQYKCTYHLRHITCTCSLAPGSPPCAKKQHTASL